MSNLRKQNFSKGKRIFLFFKRFSLHIQSELIRLVSLCGNIKWNTVIVPWNGITLKTHLRVITGWAEKKKKIKRNRVEPYAIPKLATPTGNADFGFCCPAHALVQGPLPVRGLFVGSAWTLFWNRRYTASTMEEFAKINFFFSCIASAQPTSIAGENVLCSAD